MRKTLVFAVIVIIALVLWGCRSIRPPRRTEPIARIMTVTGYCKCGKCCSWHRNWFFRPVYSSGANKGKRKEVGITANGEKAKKGTIAADTRKYPFGTIMYIEGYGYGRVEDRGGAIKGEHIDLYFRSHKEALEWGKRNMRVKVWLPEA